MSNPYHDNIEELTLANTNFRRVLWTGQHTQLVLMCLQPGEEIGMEVHDHVDQFFRFERGEGKVVANDQTWEVRDGSAVVIPAGTNHNIINTSASEPLLLYTLYSPPNHPDGTVHQTKAEAMAAEEREH